MFNDYSSIKRTYPRIQNQQNKYSQYNSDIIKQRNHMSYRDYSQQIKKSPIKTKKDNIESYQIKNRNYQKYQNQQSFYKKSYYQDNITKNDKYYYQNNNNNLKNYQHQQFKNQRNNKNMIYKQIKKNQISIKENNFKQYKTNINDINSKYDNYSYSRRQGKDGNTYSNNYFHQQKNQDKYQYQLKKDKIQKKYAYQKGGQEKEKVKINDSQKNSCDIPQNSRPLRIITPQQTQRSNYTQKQNSLTPNSKSNRLQRKKSLIQKSMILQQRLQKLQITPNKQNFCDRSLSKKDQQSSYQILNGKNNINRNVKDINKLEQIRRQRENINEQNNLSYYSQKRNNINKQKQNHQHKIYMDTNRSQQYLTQNSINEDFNPNERIQAINKKITDRIQSILQKFGNKNDL